MIRHFFLDKTATLIKGTHINTGLNPIMELSYGKGISRGILHFDETELLNLIQDKTIADLDKMTVSLKMTNCASVNGLPYEKKVFSNANEEKQRACSFNLILFKLPQCFDAGRGFDFESDFWIQNNRSSTTHPANWYFATTGYVWEVDKNKIDYNNPNLNSKNGDFYIYDEETGERHKIILEGGIYSTEFIKEQLDLYEKGEPSIILGVQHFDFGFENLNIDITSYIKSLLAGEPNYGLGLMFAPFFESIETNQQQFVSFFTDHTNTFFHPCIEVVYNESIMDDRATFTLGKDNRLYLYANIGGEPQNLDELPICTIDEVEYPVYQAQKGVYYALISSLNNNMTPNTVYYDTWSRMALNGEEINDVELEFATNSKSNYLQLGSGSELKDNVVPSVYGINNDEKLRRGEVREVTVDFRKQYTTDKKELIDSAEYILYVKDGNREIVVFDYQPVEKAFLNNFFIIHTEDLIPNEYFVSIRVKRGRETKYFKDILKFRIISDVTERYQ